MAQGGEKVVTAASELVNDPEAALDNAVSGVGRLFKRVSEGLRSRSSKHEDSTTDILLGVSKTKREYALQFGVDPYSSNPYLQKRLNEIAKAGQAGGITATALKALIPGGVGLAVSAAGGSQWLKEIDLTLPPTELRMQNRDKLLRMGIPPGLAEMFINEDDFTPSQQSLLVAALDKLKGVRGRDLFLKLALTTEDQDVALFRQRMAQMYAGYNRKASKLSGFVALDRFVGAQTVGGKLVFIFPLDYLVWTASNENIINFLTRRAKSKGASGMEPWLTGQASPMTREKLKDLGWRLHEKILSLFD